MNSICNLFKLISTQVWYELGDRHNYMLGLDERGVTDSIIYQLVKHQSHYSDRLIVRKALNEPRDGNDIDLYIEGPNGNYHRLALQAKTLFPPKVESRGKNTVLTGKKYEGIQKKKGKRGFQWEMLEAGENRGDFKAYYLLYNGFSALQFSWLGLTNKAIYDSYLGCSLVKPSEVERLTRKATGSSKSRYSPGYEAFHALKGSAATPWHTIVCSSKFLLDYSAQMYGIVDLLADDRYIIIAGSIPAQETTRQADRMQTFEGAPAATLRNRNDFLPRYQIVIRRGGGLEL